ncbi:hypothetical protein [Stenotrophomonas lactitubi]|uniref:hypothetical protein n=1 Tax=Stenotrophomonas lactitubi TaxID=2045214 RepID=UPI00203A9C2C|nr:hypothetical protein [Stenotrophomonas lactitubi]
MDAIEKRARELLAKAYVADGMHGRAGVIGDPNQYMEKPDRRALRCIIAALTLPKGYVLVPVRPTDAMKDAVESIKMPHAYLRTGIRIADFHERYSAMLTARPEAP